MWKTTNGCDSNYYIQNMINIQRPIHIAYLHIWSIQGNIFVVWNLLVCMSVACQLPVSCLSVACQLPVSCLSVGCQLPVSCLSVACQLPVSCLSVACQLPVSCLSVACQLPVSCQIADLSCRPGLTDISTTTNILTTPTLVWSGVFEDKYLHVTRWIPWSLHDQDTWHLVKNYLWRNDNMIDTWNSCRPAEQFIISNERGCWCWRCVESHHVRMRGNEGHLLWNDSRARMELIHINSVRLQRQPRSGLVQ